MLVQYQNLKNALAKATEYSRLYEQAYMGTGHPKLYVGHLRKLCEGNLKTTIDIEILEIAHAGSPVLGMLTVEDEKYIISLARDLNHCWQRLVICKELFHVILDTAANRNMDVQGHIEAYTAASPLSDVNLPAPALSVEVETLAEIAAMEFLFPYVARVKELAAEPRLDSLQIADKYKVPRVHVEKYLSDGWMAALNIDSAA